jgi:lactate dehydrogenase-like 2-hydroxyacid dehydrogenase
MELVVADPGKPEFYELKLVQLTSAGYDRVDIEAARKVGVPVANNGGANSVAVAEHAVMLMLAVLKKLVYHHNNVVAGKWRVGDFAAIRTYEVEGKRLGIVGLGNIGKKVARRVQGFDMDVRHFDILRLSEDQEDTLGVRFALYSRAKDEPAWPTDKGAFMSPTLDLRRVLAAAPAVLLPITTCARIEPPRASRGGGA